LDALSVAITSRKVNHILDADVRDFNHDWLIRFLEHRIGDRRIIRLIRKWLKAGSPRRPPSLLRVKATLKIIL
jgi:RNA-directed DNA polymerase